MRRRGAGWRIAWAAIAIMAGVVVLVSWQAIRHSPRRAHYDVPRETVAVPTDAAAIARGRHLSESVAVCTVCHGEGLGGKLAFEHPLLGRGFTPNLTSGRGGIGATYRVEDWVRALRHGVDRTGRGLMFMPIDHYAHLRDADLGAMIAYYRSLPPIDNPSAGLQLSWFARLMIDLGLSGDVVRAAQIDHAAPPAAPPANEGAYLVEIGGCTFCHGTDLNGGRGLEPGAPRAPGLRGSGPLAGRDFKDFLGVMRSGVTVSGQPIDPRFMPWEGYRRMTDEELRAVWKYLQG